MKLNRQLIRREGTQGSQGNTARRECCGPARPASRATQRGSATIIVMAILALVVVYVVANSLVTRHLKADLKLIEKQQLKKYAAPKP